jgi:hypothetical protein
MKLYELNPKSMFTIVNSHVQSYYHKNVFFIKHVDATYLYCHPVIDGIPDEKTGIHIHESTEVEPYDL